MYDDNDDDDNDNDDDGSDEENDNGEAGDGGVTMVVLPTMQAKRKNGFQ